MPTWQIVQNADLVLNLQNAPYLLTPKQTNIIRVFVERVLIGTTTAAIRYNSRTSSHSSRCHSYQQLPSIHMQACTMHHAPSIHMQAKHAVHEDDGIGHFQHGAPAEAVPLFSLTGQH